MEVSRKHSPTGLRYLLKPYPKDNEPPTFGVRQAWLDAVAQHIQNARPPECAMPRAKVSSLFLDSFAIRFKSQRAPAWTFAQVRGPLVAPPVGLEPTTLRLTAECSAN